MHRPKSEEAVGSASTSDIEPEIDETLDTLEKKNDAFTEMLTQKLSSLTTSEEENREMVDEKTPALSSTLHSESFTFEHETIDFVPVQTTGIMDSLSGKFRSLMGGRKILAKYTEYPGQGPGYLPKKMRERKCVKNSSDVIFFRHSESFTFEHETIDFVPVQTTGIMDSLSGKFRSLMGGRKEDLTKTNKRASITTTQVHFTTMPFETCEVYDGTDHKRYDIDNAISADQSKDRLIIAHHHYDDSGDNSVCVPPEFKGPEVAAKLIGDKLSGHTSAAQTLIKPLRNLKSRGQSREGRAGSYKAIPETSQKSTSPVAH
uniref:Uncharacterized protein n=2 Tax=Panagrolaimus sp. JU765 TaxID=591449 RepID=A0AC34QUA2_9BILA